MNELIIEELLENKFGNARENVLLNKYTTFNIGGPADVLVEPESEEQISMLVKFCNENELPLTFLGKGSNLLIKDKGIRGVVAVLRENFSDIKVEGNTVTAQAGASLRDTSIQSFENSLTGMEAVSGIPGPFRGTPLPLSPQVRGLFSNLVLPNLLMGQWDEMLYTSGECHSWQRIIFTMDIKIVVARKAGSTGISPMKGKGR